MQKHTVIILFNPIEKEIFYVMKGKDGIENCYYDEILEHQFSGKTKDIVLKKREVNAREYIDEIHAAGSEPIVMVQEKGLSKEAASMLELHLIWRLGRKNIMHGSLLNLHPGGKYEYPHEILENEKEASGQLEILEKHPELDSIFHKWEYEHYYNEIIRKYGHSREAQKIIDEMNNEVSSISNNEYFDCSDNDALQF